MVTSGSKAFTTGTSGIWAQDALRKWVNPVLPTAPIQVPCLKSLHLDSAGSSDSYDHEPMGKRISRFFNTGSSSQTGLDAESLQLSKSGLQGAKVISQLDSKFILCIMEEHFSSTGMGTAKDARRQEETQIGSVNKVLVVIDQHAADERVRVERLMKEMCTCSHSSIREQAKKAEPRPRQDDSEMTIITHRLDSMAMIPSLPITLTRREWHLAEQSIEWLHRWGIVLEESSLNDAHNSFDDGSEAETVMVSQHFTQGDGDSDFLSTAATGGTRVRTRSTVGLGHHAESDYRKGRVVSLPRIVADRCVVDSALTQDLIKDAVSSFEEGRYRSQTSYPHEQHGIFAIFSATFYLVRNVGTHFFNLRLIINHFPIWW